MISQPDVVLVDHAQSGVVYNFSCVCLSMCQTITSESLDVGSSFSHIQCISMEYGSSSYMKVIGSRSRSQEPKRSKKFYSHNVKI